MTFMMWVLTVDSGEHADFAQYVIVTAAATKTYFSADHLFLLKGIYFTKAINSK